MPETYKGYRRDTGAPVEFPVVWRSPEDAQLVWRWEADHNAFPVTPLSEDFSRRDAAGTSSGRFMGGNSMSVHGYRYSVRRQEGGRSSRADDSLAGLVPRIEELWDGEWRPRIERESLAVATGDYESLSISQLVERMEQMREAVSVHMDLMFRALDVVSYARNRLGDFLREVLGPETHAEALVLELIEGYDNASLQANASLWDVAQLASHSPALRSLVSASDAEGFFESLKRVEGGPELAISLHTWLERDGRRSGDYGELSIRALNEDLPTVLSLLRGYLDREDPRKATQRAAERRETLAERLEATMSAAERQQFRRLLHDAGRFIPVKESRNGVMCISRGALRMPALAAGRKLLSAGILAEVDEVFFLTFDEIRTATRDNAPRLRDLIAARRNDLEYWRNVVPPAAIGDIAVESAVDDEHVIRGVGASKGVGRGVARVILRLEDAARLQPGDVLVARTTTSAWTPLFLTAAAVITDSGGMLSHCAVVAREYQLPAVVATYGATHKIRDGDMVTVDGTNGLVTIELI